MRQRLILLPFLDSTAKDNRQCPIYVNPSSRQGWSLTEGATQAQIEAPALYHHQEAQVCIYLPEIKMIRLSVHFE
jgi:hypothetical protein